MPRKPTEADLLFPQHMRELGLFVQPEWPVCSYRKWRFDFAESYAKKRPRLAFEIEGGAWTRGRHTRGKGFIEDMHKYNHASKYRFAVLRFTPQEVISGEAKAFVKEWLEAQR